MATVGELAPDIGQVAVWFPAKGGMRFDVLVLDITEAWGKTRYLVRPIAGEGQLWTESVVLK